MEFSNTSNRSEKLFNKVTSRKFDDALKEIERVAVKVPPSSYFSLAVGGITLSAAVAAFSKKKSLVNFISLCLPTFMLIGVYNDIVKAQGSVGKPEFEAYH
jgi:hypothetical protein